MFTTFSLSPDDLLLYSSSPAFNCSSRLSSSFLLSSPSEISSGTILFANLSNMLYTNLNTPVSLKRDIPLPILPKVRDIFFAFDIFL